MNQKIYRPLARTVIVLSWIFSSLPLSAQWTSKIPQSADTLWISHNQVIDSNTVWMGGNKYSFDSANIPISGDFISIYSTIDGGKNWRYKKLGIDPADEPYLTCVNGVNGMLAWVSAYSSSGVNMIYKTTDGGSNWSIADTTTFTDPESFLNCISFKDAQNGVMVGDPIPDVDTIYHFEIYRTTDGGTNWVRIADNKIPVPLDGEYGVAGEIDRIGDKIWFATDHGRLIYSTDGGQNWQSKLVGTGHTANLKFVDNLHGICTSQDTMISDSGSLEIKYTEDGGLNWQYVKSPFKDSTYFWSLCLIPGSNYILSNNAASLQGAPFTTLLTKNKGQTWTVIGTGDGVSSAEFLTPRIGYAGEGISLGQDHGTKIFRYSGNPLNGLLIPDALKAKFTIYPNPAASKISMDIQLYKPSSLLILVNTVDGKLVWNKTINEAVNVYQEELDLDTLSPGTYIITISSPEGHLSKTFIKQ